MMDLIYLNEYSTRGWILCLEDDDVGIGLSRCSDKGRSPRLESCTPNVLVDNNTT